MGVDTMRFNGQRLEKRDADSFFGLCLGMLSDGEVNQAEAEFLLAWLDARPEVGKADPLIHKIHYSLGFIFEDGVMNDAEARVLLKILTEYTGCPAPDEVFEKAVSTLPLCDPLPTVSFADKSFCFTGTFSLGSRSRCGEILERFGGVSAKNITMKLDYLVVGHNVTLDWKHESYGNKVIKAMKYRDEKGRPVRIISEKHWVDSMRAALKARKEK